MRFPSLAVATGLVASAAFVASCGDLFHGTNWESLCDHDASSPGCNTGGGKTTGHTSSSRASSGSGGNGGTSMTGGGGAGGGPDPCMGYCNEVVDACMTDPQYETVASCINVCEILPHQGDPNADNIACRQVYAAKVGTDPTKCAAAGPGGANKCGPICDAYCALMELRCPATVGGSQMCATTCTSWDATPAYSTAVKTGNNLACHLYWAVQSVDDSTLCMKAGPASTVCVDSDM